MISRPELEAIERRRLPDRPGRCPRCCTHMHRNGYRHDLRPFLVPRAKCPDCGYAPTLKGLA